jgi:hypothetical protein
MFASGIWSGHTYIRAEFRMMYKAITYFIAQSNKRGSGNPALRLQALVVEHGFKGTDYLHHVSLGSQHRANIFIGGRCLITKAIRLAGVVPNSLHLLAEGSLGYLLSGRRPAHHPASAVRARTQGIFAAPPLNVEAKTPHRPRQDPALAEPSRHRSLSMNPEIAPAMLFKRHVIVVGGYDGVPIYTRSKLSV